MSCHNKDCAIDKTVFNPEFAGGVALPEIFEEAKL
jgi:hypothetical protein